MCFLAFHLVKDAGGTGLRILNFFVSLNADYDTERNLPYGKKAHQHLDIYIPKRPAPNTAKTYPVIVFFYGGGWSWGKKEYFEFVADAFTRHGYIVAIPNYVLYPKGKYPEFINDSAAAVAWVHSNIHRYNGNIDNLFLAGHSAGAYNAVMVATEDHFIQAQGLSTQIIKAVAGIAGPYNFTPKAERYVNIFGQEHFDDMKIQHHVSGNEPPMLLLHGKGDSTVALANQSTMAEALQAKQVEVQTQLFSSKMSHIRMLLNIHPWFASDENVGEAVMRFFDEQLSTPRITQSVQ